MLIYRTNRPARQLAMLLIILRCMRNWSALASPCAQLQSHSLVGKFIFQLLSSLVELERATITERMALGRDRVARSGK